MIDPARPDFALTPARRRYGFGYKQGPDAEPVLTVVTPFYNTNQIFHETAQTVLNQSLQHFEWIIVNDGSSDPLALEILETYRAIDPRVRVIDHETNRGLPAARNTGFALAHTSFVLQLDSDDLLEPTAAEKWRWALEADPSLAFVNGYSVGFGDQNYLWPHGFASGPAFLQQNLVAPTSLIRRNVWRSVGGYDESLRTGLEDWEFWLRCAAAGYWGRTIDEFLSWYRRRPDHSQRWASWDSGPAERDFRLKARARYPHLNVKTFPRLRSNEGSDSQLKTDSPFSNTLQKDKPRLLMIVPWLVVGGSEKFNLNLIDQLHVAGWDISVATTLPSADPWLPEFTARTPDVFRLSRFLPTTDHPRFLSYLIGSRRPDVVLISNSELGYGILPWLRARHTETLFVDFLHLEEDPSWRGGGYPQRSVEAEPYLDRTFVSSGEMKARMIARGADPRRLDVCYINVDAGQSLPRETARSAVCRAFHVSDDAPIVLFAGRISAQKQPTVLAKTLLSVRIRAVPFTALIAGDGDETPWLRDFVRRHDLERNVRLVGEVTPDKMTELMAASDILFLPSQREGIALTIYEAMASGCAIVAADVGGQRELVTPGCGFLVPPDDESQQVRAYTEFLSLLLTDGEKRQAMGERSRERIMTGFTLEAMSDHFLSGLARALEDRPQRKEAAVDIDWASARAKEAVALAQLDRAALESPEIHRMWHEVYAKLARFALPFHRFAKRRGWSAIIAFNRSAKQALDRLLTGSRHP